MQIAELDKRFCLEGKPGDGLRWISPDHPYFFLHGAASPRWAAPVRRLPKEGEEAFPEAVREIAACTAGVRLRFKTDSRRIGLRATLGFVCRMSHMPLSGSSGFDLYAAQSGETPVFQKNFMPETESREVAGEAVFPGRAMREITLCLPLYNGVDLLEIGLEPESALLEPAPYAVGKPVVFYGSSITQGGCASRPGNAYPALLSRRLSMEYVNLGFSGNARGEGSMARHIAALNPAAFVMDYDHNAPDAAYLEQTHAPFYRVVREACPSLPVVFVTKPDYSAAGEDGCRREVVRRTYAEAVNRGEAVWFVDGETLFEGRDRDACTVDGCHPNDLGFLRMADRIEPVLRQALSTESI